MSKMQKQLKLDSNSRGDWKSVRNVKWGLFTKREVREVQIHLQTAKSTLNSGLNGISMYGVLPSFRSVDVDNTDEPKTLWRALVSHG